MARPHSVRGATIHAVSGPASGVATAEPVEAIARSAVRRGVVAVARGPRGSTVTRAYAESPLKWLTPANRGTAAWLFAASYGGGLVGGDDLAIEVDVGPAPPRCSRRRRRPRSTAHRPAPRPGSRHAIGGGGLLVSLPDPVVCFASSAYAQTQTFALEPSAGLVALDWMTSGRRGSGERWAFDGYASTTRVEIGGRLALHDAVRLERADGDRHPGRWALRRAGDAGGGWWRGSRRMPPAPWPTVAALPVERRGAVLASAAPLPGSASTPGCVVRLAGAPIEDVRGVLRGLLDFVPGAARRRSVRPQVVIGYRRTRCTCRRATSTS